MPRDPEEYRRGHRDGIKAAVTWLHRQADKMNDDHARGILNGACVSGASHKARVVGIDTPERGEPGWLLATDTARPGCRSALAGPPATGRRWR